MPPLRFPRLGRPPLTTPLLGTNLLSFKQEGYQLPSSGGTTYPSLVGIATLGQGFGGSSGTAGPPLANYLLQDLFTTDLAAGSVNGTSAEPTGGARTVIDTNSKLSITGSQLFIATAGAAQGDPGLWYTSLTRAAGKFLICQVIALDTSARIFVGFDSDQSGAIIDAFNFAASSGLLNAIPNGSPSVAVATYTATTYTVGLIARSNGYFWLIKGGAFSTWSLLWLSNSGSSGVLIPAIEGQTNSNCKFDNIRVPVPTYMPAPIAYDTFTRADGALGSTETTGPDSQALAAKTWTGATYTISTNKTINTPTTGADVVVNGTFSADTDWNKGAGWTIAAGTAVATAASSDITAAVAPLTLGAWYQTAFTQGGFGGGTVNVKLGTTAFPTHAANGTFTETGRATSTALALTGAGLTDTIDNFSALPLTLSTLFASVVASTADVIADINVTLVGASDGKQAGLVLNLDSTSSPANFIIVYLDGNGNCKADECVAGVYTNKISAAVTYSAGAVLRAVRSGTDLRVFYNNAAVGSLATMTANTNVNHGLFNTSPLNSLDVFTLWARGTSNEYSTLDNF